MYKRKPHVLLLLAACLTIILASCGKPEPIMPSMITSPTPSQGKNTGTPAPATDTPATATPVPFTPTPTFPPITPVPTSSAVNGSDFFEVLRLLAQGTRVDTDGATQAQLERCFYAEELNRVELDAFLGAGFTETEAQALYKLRTLYYRTDGKIYVGEVYVSKTDAPRLLNSLKKAFDTGLKLSDMSEGFADDFFIEEGFRVRGIMSGNREYLYLK